MSFLGSKMGVGNNALAPCSSAEARQFSLMSALCFGSGAFQCNSQPWSTYQTENTMPCLAHIPPRTSAHQDYERPVSSQWRGLGQFGELSRFGVVRPRTQICSALRSNSTAIYLLALNPTMQATPHPYYKHVTSP